MRPNTVCERCEKVWEDRKEEEVELITEKEGNICSWWKMKHSRWSGSCARNDHDKQLILVQMDVSSL